MLSIEMLDKLDRVYDLSLEKDSLGVEQISRFDVCLKEIEAIRLEFSQIGFSLIVDDGLPMLMASKHE